MLDQKASHLAGGVTRVEKAKIGLIQFCISPPKTDVRLLEHFPIIIALLAHIVHVHVNICVPVYRSTL